MLRFYTQNLTVRPYLVAAQLTIPFDWPIATRFSKLAHQLHSPRTLSKNRISDNQRLLLSMGKRKHQSSTAPEPTSLPPRINGDNEPPPAKRRASQRKVPQRKYVQEPEIPTDPDQNADVLDGAEAWRASPDADERMDVERVGTMNVRRQIKDEEDAEDALLAKNGNNSDSSLSELSDLESPTKTGGEKVLSKEEAVISGQKSRKVSLQTVGGKKKEETKAPPQFLDPEADGEEEPDEEELQAALSRPPPVNSDYLPLPWKGRLGYACLCTYLRFSNPPVFSSRTCRIASILENRHPLKDPNEPPHTTKNRPDRDQPASIARGQAFVESLGLANARDIPKMLRWNERYGIRFLRLSSEMFPFASHEEYGYTLAPFASEVLAEAGKVAAELGHRLTTHPGQFTQLGSPRKQVIENAIRDLEYHAELLSLLKLPPQQDRDAVMILHLGGVFGDKAATLDRFRDNYKRLSQDIKDRLVLENDDVSWSVHDLLPICEELNIPMVLDFHHHNIIFDADKIREGTKDIINLYPRILATWERKKITPKMHYSEPTPSAITGRQRRKHNPRVATLPPCPPTMDLMIEAKDKEQAVFELMRTYKLPGFDTFNDIIPHARKDDNKPIRIPKKKSPRKKSKKSKIDNDDEEQNVLLETPNDDEDPVQAVILDDDVGMGGPDGRVYWPPGMEHWLRPMKKIIKPKRTDVLGTASATPVAKRKAAAEASKAAVKLEDEVQQQHNDVISDVATPTKKAKAAPKKKNQKGPGKKMTKNVPTPLTSDDEVVHSDEGNDIAGINKKSAETKPAPKRNRSTRAKKITYTEDLQENAEMEDEIEAVI